MKYYSTTFYKGLLGAVKQAVKRSPKLKRQVKLNRVGDDGRLRLWLGAAVFFIAIPFTVVRALIQAPVQLGGATAAIALFALCVVPFMVLRLNQTLRTDGDLFALMLLPVDDATLFRGQLWKFLVHSIWYLFSLAMVFCVFLYQAGLPPLLWLLVPVVAALTWLAAIALTMIAALYLPIALSYYTTIAMFVTAVAWIFANKTLGSAPATLVGQYQWHIQALLPTAWPGALLRIFTNDAGWIDGAALAMSLLLVAALRPLYRQLLNQTVRDAYRPDPRGETAQAAPADAASGNGGGEAEAWAGPMYAGTATQRPEIRFHDNGCEPAEGWLEKKFWAWLTPREKVLCELAFPVGYTFRRPWKKIAVLTVTTALAGFAMQRFQHAAAQWMWLAGFGAAAIWAVAQTLARGVLFETFFLFGVGSPCYAFFPVGYREMSHLLFKYSLVQLPFVLAFCCTVGGLLAAPQEGGVAIALSTGIKVTVLTLVLRVLATVSGISGNSNDTTRRSWRSYLLLIVFFVQFMLFLGLAVYSVVVSWDGSAPASSHTRAWLTTMLAVLVAWSVHALYGWLHDSGRFDLMTHRP